MFFHIIFPLFLEKDLSLSIKGSYEGTQTFKLGSDAVLTPPCPTTFHYIKYKDPSLNVKLPKTKQHYNPVCQSNSLITIVTNVLSFIY